MKTKRNYPKEYRDYHSKPEEKRRRALRNAARNKMKKAGKVSKNDGMDVHHKDNDPRNNAAKNLSILRKSKNRSMK